MSKLSNLLKVHILNLFGINILFHTKDKSEKRKLAVPLISSAIIFVFLAVFLFIINSFSLSVSGEAAANSVLTSMFIVSSFMAFLTTVYKGSSVLFAFSDYDSTLSLPISKKTIISSRILILYLTNLSILTLFLIPSGVAYALAIHPPIAFYPVFLITFILIPVVPVIISTALSILFAFFSSKFKISKILNLILLVAFLAVYMVFIMNLNSSGSNDMLYAKTSDMLNSLAINSAKFYPLVSVYSKAVCNLDIISIVIFILSSVLLFAGFVWVVSKIFDPMHSALTDIKSKKNSKSLSVSSSAKQTSPIISMYKKEVKYFFSNTMYVMNSGIGGIMLVILSVMTLINKKQSFIPLTDGSENLSAIISVFITCLCICLCCTTAPSISLEGKHLWILKSSPVKPMDVFISKILVNLTVSIPCILVSTIIYCIANTISGVYIVYNIVTPILYSILIAMSGIFFNLFSPNFHWKNEITVIKQSLPTFLALILGFFVSVVPFVIYIIIIISAGNASLIYLTLALIVINFTLYKLLNLYGTRLFLKLEA